MIKLGGVTLNPNMIWSNRREWSPIAQVQERTLGGTLVVFNQSLTAGRPITLEATDTQGWLTYAQVSQLQAMANEIGSVFTLEINAERFSVIFDHSNPPAFKANPIVETVEDIASMYYTCTISLVTV